MFQDIGNPIRHDQQMAQRSGTDICQRFVGEHSLSGYGPIGFMNRPMRTRLWGGVGTGGEKPPVTRLGRTMEI